MDTQNEERHHKTTRNIKPLNKIRINVVSSHFVEQHVETYVASDSTTIFIFGLPIDRTLSTKYHGKEEGGNASNRESSRKPPESEESHAQEGPGPAPLRSTGGGALKQVDRIGGRPGLGPVVD